LARELALELYPVTALFPQEEKYGLTAQIRRAAVSVKSDIAEGAARRTTIDYLRFLYDARGSLEELDSQLELAGDLNYLEESRVQRAVDIYENLSRALQALINSLERKVNR
jgi:four helix bundle protein